MRTIKKLISHDVYEHYMNMPKAEQRAEIENTVPMEWICGYGYYGYYLTEEEDGCFINFHVGSSCD